MNPNNPFTTDDNPNDHSVEALAEGGTWLLDLVAAVDYLCRGHRPNFTVWDALEEALRWTTVIEADDQTTWNTDDPLASALRRVLDATEPPVAARLQRAVRHWVIAMANRCNNGAYWPHPTARRGFPPPLLDSGIEPPPI